MVSDGIVYNVQPRDEWGFFYVWCMDFGSIIRRFEPFLPSLIARQERPVSLNRSPGRVLTRAGRFVSTIR
jgi:hypothetical protein